MVTCFLCDGQVTFFINNLSERQVKHQMYFIHIYNIVWLDGILHYLCLSDCAEVSKFFLVVGRELLTQNCALMSRPFRLTNLNHRNGPLLKYSIFISVAIALAFSLICTVETPQPTSL